jgi:hypothetical protein
MTSDSEATQPFDSENVDAQFAAVYDPTAYVVQGPAVLPRHKRTFKEATVTHPEAPGPSSESLDHPPLSDEPSLPEQIAEQIAVEVAAEVAETTEQPAELGGEEPVIDQGLAEPGLEEQPDHAELPRLAHRGPRRMNESALYRAREYEAVHAERRASMTRRSQILALGMVGVGVLLGGAAVGSGLANSRSILVGVFCFGAPFLLQMIVAAWLEESIRAVRSQDYLVALEAAINEHLGHRSVGFETWLRRPHSKLELPYRWVTDFAVVLSVTVAVIGWKSAHLSGVDFLWAVCVPALIAGTSRYWAERTLRHLETESRRRIRLSP